jgi:hypothetical protein
VRRRRLRAFGTAHELEQAPDLSRVTSGRYDEIVAFVRHHRLHGRGIGWIDAHLLASALVGRLRLWTTDPPLATFAKELGIAK